MKSGFTLLELSIVLVIIGLIIGGITVGADLIRAAELNSVARDISKYKLAVNAFKLKYNAMPGDMKNAQSYWPSCIDNGANSCNSNGDGLIVTGFEGMRFWQHLSLSGIINGSYLGNQIAGLSDEDNYTYLLNFPLIPEYVGTYEDKTDATVSLNRHLFFQFFSDTEIKELEMIQLDTKFDDALPESGGFRMRLGDASGSDCLTNTSPADYDYTASGSFNECYPAFLF